jgi:hypothetical protein
MERFHRAAFFLLFFQSKLKFTFKKFFPGRPGQARPPPKKDENCFFCKKKSAINQQYLHPGKSSKKVVTNWETQKPKNTKLQKNP